MNEIIAFTLIAFLLVISPGPNSVLILKTASSNGKRAALVNILGLTSATYVHGLFSILGISALLMRSAEVFFIVKILGAAYLFYIGVKAILGSFTMTPEKREQLVTAKPVATKSGLAYFTEGFLTQILNPKVSMFYLAAFPQFTHPESFSFFSSFLLVFIHATIILCWFSSLTLVISRMKPLASSSTLGLWLQRFSGAVMIYFSTLIIAEKR